jgi:hypothetical protein
MVSASAPEMPFCSPGKNRLALLAPPGAALMYVLDQFCPRDVLPFSRRSRALFEKDEEQNGQPLTSDDLVRNPDYIG